MQRIGVIDTKHNRWKREKNRTRGKKVTAKVWEINDFLERLS